MINHFTSLQTVPRVPVPVGSLSSSTTVAAVRMALFQTEAQRSKGASCS